MLFNKLFRNRWSALLWSGGILWTAYDVAGAAPPAPVAADNASQATTDATGTAVNPDDLAVLANFGGASK